MKILPTNDIRLTRASVCLAVLMLWTALCRADDKYIAIQGGVVSVTRKRLAPGAPAVLPVEWIDLNAVRGPTWTAESSDNARGSTTVADRLPWANWLVPLTVRSLFRPVMT